MPTKTLIFSAPIVQTRFHLEDALAPLLVRGLLTRSQLHVICTAAAPALPGAVELHQRTPKSVTYVRAGSVEFRVNVRAKLIRVYPSDSL